MAHKIGFVDNTSQLAHYEMLALIRRFAMGYGETGTVGYTGTGNGTLTDEDALPGAVDETWTITCTAAAVDGGTFSVVGSVSGAQADATVGVAYENTFISFLINDGTTDFVVNDVFSFATTQSTVSANGENWTELYYDDVSENRELILKGTGLSRLEAIYIGFKTYHSVGADYYNMAASTFTGYVESEPYDSQPGAVTSGIPAHNQRIDYWLTVNGQRIAFALKVGTPVYESAYVGKFNPYARPSQFPYPVVCCGMLDGTPATRFSDTAHSMPYKGYRNNMKMRDTLGVWTTPDTFPYDNHKYTNLRDTEGNYHLTPVELYKASANLWGALDGIYHITGFNNTVENTVTIAGVDYVVIQNVYRTDFDDYYAIRMDT